MRNILFLAFLILTTSSPAQTIIHADPLVQEMTREVSADSLKSYIQQLVSFGTRHTLSLQNDAKKGIGASRNWVLSQFNNFAKQSGGRLTAFIDTTTLAPDGRRVNMPTLLGNVVATLKGTDPNDNRIFIIGAHLDSRASDVMNATIEAPGANDDGSGVAAVIECARIMSKRSFPATVIFVAFSGEEQGLLGAAYMAQKAARENWNIEAVLNNDMLGNNNSSETNITDNTRVRIFSEAFAIQDTGRAALNIRSLGLENDGRSRQLARYIKEVGERYVDHLEVVLIYRNDRFLRGGDHTAFVQKGFPAIRITEMNENYNYQHQDVRTEQGVEYGDLLKFMDFEYLRKNTMLNLASLANLAKSAGLPHEVKMDVTALTNYTSISWKAPATGNAKGYYLLVRETSSPVWQKKIYTTVLSMQLPYSKDNYFFAVQSVTATGNESLPVIPSISR